jgi:hypothetical protein
MPAMASRSRLGFAFQLALCALVGLAVARRSARRPRLSTSMVHTPVRASEVGGALARLEAAVDARARVPALALAPTVARPAPATSTRGLLRPLLARVPVSLYAWAFVVALGVAPVALALAYVSFRGSAPDAEAPPAVARPATGAVLGEAARSPGPGDVLIDARRQLDLATDRDALLAWATIYGAFPDTGGTLTTLCDNPRDAACPVAGAATDMPVGDREFPYWYASDGSTFTLLARVQTPPARDDCPPRVRDVVGDTPVFCLNGRLP